MASQTMQTMQGTGSFGRARFGTDRRVNGCRVFSATMVAGRESLGEEATRWLAQQDRVELREAVVTQSSDESFHCVSLTLFYWEDLD